MKASQILLIFIGVFVFLTIVLLTVAISPRNLLAQPPVTPTANISTAPNIDTVSSVFSSQNSSDPISPTFTNEDHLVFLPIINSPSCSLNAQEQSLATLIEISPNQIRPTMTCDPTLAQVARERALDMGQRNYFDHVNPDGFGPNYLVVQAGYILPDGWTSPTTLNYIESIAGGTPTAADTYFAWIFSTDGHRTHVLGEDIFWATQTNYGVGYAYVENSTYKHYWVFISAPPQP